MRRAHLELLGRWINETGKNATRVARRLYGPALPPTSAYRDVMDRGQLRGEDVLFLLESLRYTKLNFESTTYLRTIYDNGARPGR